MELKEELCKAVAELAHGTHEVPFQLETSHLTQYGAERLLMECVVNREYAKALLTMKAVR